MPEIKYIKHPYFAEADLTTENPLLLKGEIVFAVPAVGDPYFKVGDGVSNFNDLPATGADQYPYADLVTNPLGDLVNGSNQQGREWYDIMKDIISPYVAPVISGEQNNAAGAYVGTAQMEIGQTINTDVTVQYSVSEQANLVGANPITITAPQFTVSNPYPVGDIVLTPTAPITPTTPAIYTIDIDAVHQQGNALGSTIIRFDPRIISGVAAVATLTVDTDIDNLLSKSQVVSSDFTRDYVLGAVGYGYVLIPEMLSPGAPTWTDITNPATPATIGMIDQGVYAGYNNGVGTYDYRVFRTPFSLLSGITVRSA